MASLLLRLIGWNIPKLPKKLLQNDRIVLVISHTTRYDFLYFLLYRSIYPDLTRNLYIVVKPQLFEYWGWFLRPLGCVPATKLESSGAGFVKSTIDRFNNKDFKLVISPEGTTNKSNWRSGYYYIRQGLQADIAVCGIDYEKKSIYIGPVYEYEDIEDLTLDEMNNMLIKDMGQIVPLYPKCSKAKITRKYKANNIGLIDWWSVILILILIIIIIIIIWICYKIYNKETNSST